MVLAKQLIAIVFLFIAIQGQAQIKGLDLETFKELNHYSDTAWSKASKGGLSDSLAFEQLTQNLLVSPEVQALTQDFGQFLGSSELDFFKALSEMDPRKFLNQEIVINPLTRLILSQIVIQSSFEIIKISKDKTGMLEAPKRLFTDLLYCSIKFCPPKREDVFTPAELYVGRKYLVATLLLVQGTSNKEFCKNLVDSNFHLNLSRLIIGNALYEQDLFFMNGYITFYTSAVRSCATADYEQNYKHLYKIPDAKLVQFLTNMEKK